MKPLYIVILAAGNSTRLKSQLTKVMHPICGRPMIDYVLEAARALRPKKLVLVLGNGREAVVEHLRGQKDLGFALQKERKGTAHAAQTGLASLPRGDGRILILNGDVPRLKASTLKGLIRAGEGAELALLTAVVPNPQGYGRIIRDADGKLQAIVEEKNCSPFESQINEINAGVYYCGRNSLEKWLRQVPKDRLKKEFYLTDIVQLARSEGKKVQGVTVGDAHEILGVNNRAELAYLNQLRRQEILALHLERGVGMEDPDSSFIDQGVSIGEDSFLGAGVHLLGATRIGRGCAIEPGCILKDSSLGAGVRVKAYSHLDGCVVGDRAVLGPFARLRPETVIEAEAQVGNFVELKKTRLGKGSKANHLSYLGDAEIGAKVNVGAGTITCNYDGRKKHRTKIRDGVFIGSDVQLVAPVEVGKQAYIGAGATVTENVPAGALAISRVPQKNVLGYAKRKVKREK